MNEDFVTQIQKRMAELPADVRSAIESSDFDIKVQAVGKRHALHFDQMEKLADEVLLVMLGFMKTDDFTANIATEIGVSAEKAGLIASDINNEVLLPIRESLKTVPEAPAAPATPAPAPAAAPTPIHPGELVLSQKTVTVPPAITTPPPPKPTDYKADPYREPPLP